MYYETWQEVIIPLTITIIPLESYIIDFCYTNIQIPVKEEYIYNTLSGKSQSKEDEC